MRLNPSKIEDNEPSAWFFSECLDVDIRTVKFDPKLTFENMFVLWYHVFRVCWESLGSTGKRLGTTVWGSAASSHLMA